VKTPKNLRDKISQGIKSVKGQEGVLILTDMFGGTPSNLSYSFLEEGRIEVLSGVNLPVLIQAAKHEEKNETRSTCDRPGIFRQKKYIPGQRNFEGQQAELKRGWVSNRDHKQQPTSIRSLQSSSSHFNGLGAVFLLKVSCPVQNAFNYVVKSAKTDNTSQIVAYAFLRRVADELHILKIAVTPARRGHGNCHLVS
jgi:hypothetical protein